MGLRVIPVPQGRGPYERPVKTCLGGRALRAVFRKRPGSFMPLFAGCGRSVHDVFAVLCCAWAANGRGPVTISWSDSDSSQPARQAASASADPPAGRPRGGRGADETQDMAALSSSACVMGSGRGVIGRGSATSL